MTRFDFVERASQEAVARDELSGSEYWVNDRVFAQALGDVLQPAVADLITVALACYAADRLARRTSAWTRPLELRVALRDPDPWIRARDVLEAYLGALTDDRWAFHLVPGRRGRLSEHQGTLFPVDLAGSGSIGLFSGGLDSLAGAAQWLESNEGPLVLLGARSSPVVGRDQRAVALELRRRFQDRVIEVGVPLRLRRSLSRESSQRTRGFLFLSLAAAAALTSRAEDIVVFENGYGSHNPRLAENQFGSQATLGTHPHLLRLFEQLMACLGMPVAVRLPHAWETKAELLRGLRKDLVPLVALTSSCDGYPLRVAGRTHCGVCGSCVLRQQSLIAAGLEEADRSDYLRRPFDRGGQPGATSRLMARQAWQFARLSHVEAWEEIGWRWPSLTLGLDETSWQDRAAVIGLMRTYSDEWSALVTSRPYLRTQLRWPADDWRPTA